LFSRVLGAALLISDSNFEPLPKTLSAVYKSNVANPLALEAIGAFLFTFQNNREYNMWMQSIPYTRTVIMETF